jgi:hypothetical protein
MPGEFPFFIRGKITEIMPGNKTAIVKVSNGNTYHVTPNTPGIEFDRLVKDLIVECEVTTMLTRVLSARIVKE